MRGTKRKAEDEGEHEGAKRQDGMIVGCLGAEEVTRRNIHEALTTRGRRYYFGSAEESNDKDVSMAMYVPTQEDHEDELTEAWDDIDGQQLDPEVVRKARAPEMEWCRKMIVFEKRPIEECFEKTWKPPIRVKWVDHNKGDRQKHEREIQAGGKAKPTQARNKVSSWRRRHSPLFLVFGFGFGFRVGRCDPCKKITLGLEIRLSCY